MATRQRTSEACEFLTTALGYPLDSPMAHSAGAVCELRGVDPWEHIWFYGAHIERWRAVIIEGMMLYSIAEETARRK